VVTARPAHRLEEAIRSQFTGVYLAVIGVVQGLTLAWLAPHVVSGYAHYSAFQWIANANLLLAILVTWQEYLIGSLAFSWIPTIIDTMVPFGLGLAEFIIIQTIDRGSVRAYCIATAAGWTLALGSSANLYRNAHRLAVNSAAARILHKHLVWNLIVCAASPVWHLLLLASVFSTRPVPDWLIASLSAVPTLFLFVRMPLHFNRKLRQALEVENDVAEAVAAGAPVLLD
jgi:hypothetical protein